MQQHKQNAGSFKRASNFHNLIHYNLFDKKDLLIFQKLKIEKKKGWVPLETSLDQTT